MTEKLISYDLAKLAKQKGFNGNDDINVYDIVNYLRRKGILPEQDLLFEVSY